ncbi:hypothetical protein [Acrocarpospora phusangensis]|nr:hypothetical protein [Acrocarpospora phusangensis]
MSSTVNSAVSTTILGYRRIGPDRELEHATEALWAGRIDAARLG